MIGPEKNPYIAKWILTDDEQKIVGCRVWIPDVEKGPKESYYYGVLQVASKFELE
jgi:hypothetical protein